MLKSVAKQLRRHLPWQGFGDSRRSILGHPYYIARSALRSHIASAAECAPSGPLLDVGCGSMPYRDIFAANRPYECLEIDQPRNQNKRHVTHLYEGHEFHLSPESYAVTFSSKTLEHSFARETMLAEMHRVLKPGGVLVLAMPFFWPEHEQPYDSQRFTSFGLRARLEAIGFVDVRVSKTNPGLAALLQLGIEVLERHVRRVLSRCRKKHTQRLAETILRSLLAVPYFGLGVIAALVRRVPQDVDRVELYLDLVVSAKKPLGSTRERT